MFRPNCGKLDRTVRLVSGAILVPVGLFMLRGLQGNDLGVVAAGFGCWALATGAFGFCGLYLLFSISTVDK